MVFLFYGVRAVTVGKIKCNPVESSLAVRVSIKKKFLEIQQK